MPTTLSTSSKRRIITGVYISESICEYARGNAANRAPPAVMSQTWLASQNGAIDLIVKSLRLASVENPREIPAPKSNPPVIVNIPSSTPTSANQTVSKNEISILKPNTCCRRHRRRF